MTRSVVVIGNFDGVHPGHQQVLAAAREAEPGAPLVVVTFWPHPMAVIRPDGAPKLLTNLEDRVALLRRAGADEVRVLEFTRELSQQGPEQFVEQHLLPLDPVRIVVGENFRFGYRAQGTVQTMTEIGAGHFEVDAMPLVAVEGDRTCSTLIRECLESGDVEQASRHLGRWFRLRGVVVMGDQRGREMGFPTANLPVPALLACPEDGVYAGWLFRLDGRDAHGELLAQGEAPARWPAAISVGTNPTFDGVERRVETYVLDRTDLQLYGSKIAVDFVARLRGQVTFTGMDSLIEQMHADVVRTREILKIN